MWNFCKTILGLVFAVIFCCAVFLGLQFTVKTIEILQEEFKPRKVLQSTGIIDQQEQQGEENLVEEKAEDTQK